MFDFSFEAMTVSAEQLSEWWQAIQESNLPRLTKYELKDVLETAFRQPQQLKAQGLQDHA